MAQAIKEGIETLGGFDVRMFDMVETNTAKAVDEIIQSDGFLLGTPTILSDALKPIWDITSNLNPVIVKDKYASAFGSYGWSGEGVPHIIERLKQLRLKVSDGISVKFNPNEEKLQSCRQFGIDFAQQILSNKKTVD
jgi:flavorubredoxin